MLRTKASAAPTSDRRVEEFARIVSFESEPATLPQAIAKGLKDLVRCKGVLWFQLRRDSAMYTLEPANSVLDEALQVPLAFPADSDLVRWLRVNSTPLVLADAFWLASYVSREDRELLRVTNTRVCLPLKASTSLSTVLLLTHEGPKWKPLTSDYAALIACACHAAIAWEVSARREAEREELAAKTRAQQLVVAGQLAASVAHEVRNPLTAIRSSVQLARESTGVNSEDRNLLGHVLEEVDRINKTISSILGLSRPHPLQLEDVDFDELIERTLTFLQAYMAQQDVKLERHPSRDALPVRGDVRELRQVLLNVLLNAAQATPKGGTITVRSSHGASDVEPDVSMAVVTVTDTGHGMTQEQIARAFDPFFTTKPLGTGLGLPICLEIVSHHGGQIHLSSQVGTGTTVRLTLPLRAS